MHIVILKRKQFKMERKQNFSKTEILTESFSTKDVEKTYIFKKSLTQHSIIEETIK